AERARCVRAGAARRSRRLVRRPDAPAARARTRRRRRAAARRPPRRDRRRGGSRPLRPARGAGPAGGGGGGERGRARRGRRAGGVGYPVLVRPHHVLGGRGMHVAHSAGDLRVDGPVLVDRYLEGALELDVDALCDGEDAWVAAVLEHVEPAGVHSGDSACVLPGPSVTAALEADIREAATRIARGTGARGLLNLQLALAD